ncbi:FAR1 DNA binding domain, zinc finger, SWIM-type, MULE transposase domain containing protein [Tanacetum coccineum]|uniref:FAR1 DNA binding domain, zinc finger, SWIM-type, MULE transposase domain containing protein n=1 Tax=Tanacetum coccineum TaxID=301880 RepID=A0ABQ4XXE5_9ASTR
MISAGWWLKGGDGGEVLQAFSLKNNPLKGSTLSGMICVGCVKNGRNERLFIGFFGAKMEKYAALIYKCAALGASSALGPKIKVDENSFTDAWPPESRQTEFVCSSYGQNIEPSTSHSINNVQDAVIGDDQSIPQVGSYQPTPEGSKFWIPDAKNKPVKGTIFDTLELALNFYKDYAREAGFEVRRGGFKPTSNNVNKKIDKVQSDEPQSQVVNKVINRRKRTSQRCRCDAKLRIRRTNENKWRVYMFLEKHNHRLVREEDYMYLKVARKLSFPQQKLLNHISTVNLAAIQQHPTKLTL